MNWRQALWIGTLIFLGCLVPGLGLAQEVLDLYPEVEPLLLSEANAQKFEQKIARAEKLWKELGEGKSMDDLAPEDRQLLNEIDETMTSYWDIIGGGCSWYCGGGPKEVKASSELKSQGSINYQAGNAHDLDYKTVWVEGVPGNGIGEYLLYEFEAMAPRINQISVVNGYVKSDKTWRQNGRVKTLKVWLKDKPFAILHLEDSRSAQHFTVPLIGEEPGGEKIDRRNWTLKFEIVEVYPGEVYEDVVISEIYFDGIDVHCFKAGTPIWMGDGSERPIETIKAGDLVWSMNDSTGELEIDTVVHTMTRGHRHMVDLIFNNGDTLTCTPDHPIKSSDGSWLSCAPAKTSFLYDLESVDSLTVGMEVGSKNGPLKVVELRVFEDPQLTYTITKLKNNRTFFARGIQVGTEPQDRSKQQFWWWREIHARK
ncbi:hypothetical protein KFE98_09680 [bacterium SCSIO 12741]|nr:hypothetical protein KFE98_09680 [bacterium SCSIO 12741]